MLRTETDLRILRIVVYWTYLISYDAYVDRYRPFLTQTNAQKGFIKKTAINLLKILDYKLPTKHKSVQDNSVGISYLEQKQKEYE